MSVARAARRFREFLYFLVQLGAALAIFPVLSDRFLSSAKLKAAVYEEPVIFWGALDHEPFQLMMVIACAIPLLRRRACTWRSLGPAEPLRIVIVGGVAIIAWGFSCYDYNLYMDQAHTWDRFLVVALAFGVWAHPGFVGVFTLVTMSVVFQFHQPLGGLSWTDKRLMFDVLIMFHIFLCGHALTHRTGRAQTRLGAASGKRLQIDWRLCLTLMLCVVGTHYLYPAFTKADMNWTDDNELYRLFVVSHLNGWSTSLSDESVLQLAQHFRKANPLLIWGTMIIEYLALVVLANRRAAQVVIASFAALHIGIFLMSGIFFWKWFLFDLVLIAFLAKRRERASIHATFSVLRRYFWLSVPLIWYGHMFFNPVPLGWIDTGLSNTYDLEAVGVSGRTYPVGRDFMSPYDIVFAQNRFAFLDPDRNLTLTYGGVTHPKIAKALNSATDVNVARKIERRFSKRAYHKKRARRFHRFVQRVFVNLNRHGSKKRFPLPFRAPHHIWSSGGSGAYDVQEPVTKVRIRRRTVFYDGQALHELRNKVVTEIRIPRE